MKKKKSRFVIRLISFSFVLFVLVGGVLGLGESARAQTICSEGEITEICVCNGVEHSSGHCCTGVWDQNACRVFYEDYEDIDFTEFFAERTYGTGNLDYWNEITSDIIRSSENPYDSNYCMVYDPFTTGNPHAVVGYGNATYGNTRHFDLSSINSRTWYFRWYQRWEEGINWSGSAQQKIFYLNYMDSGDFVIMIQKNDSNGFHTEIKHVAPDYYYVTGGDMYYKNYNNNNLDDMQIVIRPKK